MEYYISKRKQELEDIDFELNFFNFSKKNLYLINIYQDGIAIIVGYVTSLFMKCIGLQDKLCYGSG